MFSKLIIVAAMAMLSIGAQAGIASANMVTNGGFETGDFTGWTLTNIDLSNDFVFVDTTGTQQSGNYEALLGKSGSVGAISQALATTAGQAYMVNFWLANDDLNSLNTNVFQALWNGVVQNINPVLNPDLASPYTDYQFTATAADASSTMAFNFRNDPSIFHLDDVTAAPVPEPSTMLLLGAGLTGLVMMRRMREA